MLLKLHYKTAKHSSLWKLKGEVYFNGLDKSYSLIPPPKSGCLCI